MSGFDERLTVAVTLPEDADHATLVGRVWLMKGRNDSWITASSYLLGGTLYFDKSITLTLTLTSAFYIMSTQRHCLQFLTEASFCKRKEWRCLRKSSFVSFDVCFPS